MNRVKEIERINKRELEMGGNGTTGSWHDEYRDSAYVYVGGLPDGITEGDLITICSQYGEVADVNMPRDKETGKTRGFGFIMYEDQRSTVLAVDNLGGGKVLDRIIRVDHVKNYKQPKVRNADGEWVDQDEQSLNALPPLIRDGVEADNESVSSAPSIDPEDPMRDYLLQKRKEQKANTKSSKKRKHEHETLEERRARKEKKRVKKAKARAVENIGHRPRIEERHRRKSSSRTPPRPRSPSHTPPLRARGEHIEMLREGGARDSGTREGERAERERERDKDSHGDRHRDIDQYHGREGRRDDGRDYDRARDRERSRDDPRHGGRRRADSRSPRRAR